MTNPLNSNEENTPETIVEYPESPVSGDANLSEGELPFTAFGQFGKDSLDIRVFEQDIYWVNKEGVPFLIEEMATDYLSNVLEFLSETAEYYFVALANKAAVELLCTEPESRMASSAFNTLRSMADATEPAEWIRNTVLVQKLTQVLVSKLNQLLN